MILVIMKAMYGLFWDSAVIRGLAIVHSTPNAGVQILQELLHRMEHMEVRQLHWHRNICPDIRDMQKMVPHITHPAVITAVTEIISDGTEIHFLIRMDIWSRDHSRIQILADLFS